MAPPLSVIKIVKYCGAVGGGGGSLVALKSYKHNGDPSLSLRLLSIAASGEGGGVSWGAPKSYKKRRSIKINKYCGVGGVWGALGRRENSTKDNGAPSLSL